MAVSWGGKYSAMERPSLIQDLRSILDEYPDNGQILKELIQNAEDASASRIKFWYDERNINTDPGDKCPNQLQGPALYAYNDAQFTEEDWRGIKMLHQSVKAEDPLKVGRFGLGFKSVFHITDYPCVISGERGLLINPIQSEESEKRVCLEIDLSECCHYPAFQSAFCEVRGAPEILIQNGVLKGTIFRFPLRRTPSVLSHNTYDNDRVQGLFEAFKTDSLLVLLFLKSLESIDILTSSQTVILAVSLTQESIADRKSFKTALDKIVNTDTTTLTEPLCNVAKAVVTIENVTSNESFQHTWCVANLFLGGRVSEKMTSLLRDKSLSYSPVVGVAVRLRSPFQVEHELCEGHVFCFLPLPLQHRSMTGLPVHVNGFFALSQNRHHLKWPTADEEERGWDKVSDKACLWNHCLLEEAIPQVYVRLVEDLIRRSEDGGNPPYLVSQVYSALPDHGIVDSNWMTILEPLWRLLMMRTFVFCNAPRASNGGRWLRIAEAILHVESTDVTEEQHIDREVIGLLLKWGINVCTVPALLYESIKQHTTNMPETLSPTIVRRILRQRGADIYTVESNDIRLQLLSYILRDETFTELHGIKLLPLANKTFTTFSSKMANKVLLPTDDFPLSLFPTLQRSQKFVWNVKDDLSSPGVMSEKLNMVAISGCTQIQPVRSSDVHVLLRQEVGNNFHRASDRQKVWKWLKQVWSVLHNFFPGNLDEFDGLPLLPVGTELGFTTEVLQLHSRHLLTTNQFSSLPPHVSTAILKLGVELASTVPEWVLKHRAVLTVRLHPPTQDGVLRALDAVSASGNLNIERIRTTATMEELESLVTYFSSVVQFGDKDKVVMKTIPMFKAGHFVDGPFDNVAIKEIRDAASGGHFPVPFPRKLLILDTNEMSRLADKLGVRRLDTVQIAQDIFCAIHKYSEENKLEFMLHILKNMPNPFQSLSDQIKALPFVRCCSIDDSKSTTLINLFDPTNPKLVNLFLFEDRFPEMEFRDPSILNILKGLGLRSERAVTTEELYSTAVCLNEMSTQTELSPSTRNLLLIKAKSFVAFLASHSQIIEECCRTTGTRLMDAIQLLRCVPHKSEKPSYLPRDLPWFQPEQSILCLPGQIKTDVYEEIVCSILGILPSNGILENVVNSSLASKLGWMTKPTVPNIIKQLQMVLRTCSDSDLHLYLPVLRKLYDAMGDCDPHDIRKVLITQNLLKSKWIWTGSLMSAFTNPEHVYINGDPGDIALEPFMCRLPEDRQRYEKLYRVVGCRANQDVRCLLNVLCDTKEKHDQHSFDTATVSRERTLVVNILNKLKQQCEPDEIVVFQDELFVPVRSDDPSKLRLSSVPECTFCDTTWLGEDLLTSQDEDEENYSFVHEEVPSGLALALGVTPLIKKLFDADELDLNFGQSEPLTRRLKNLLMDYTDGLAMPKELIQNADDAGATEVCFLYDERENLDLQCCLMNDKLSDFQGPAFWVYNNADFKDSDFDNIVKLSGGTKEKDSTKIGKFGLGFNAVYNLTDVPSFVSRDRFVMFDPHTTNLGRQGIKVNIVKKRRMMKRFKNQFLPYQGIFGCDLASEKPCYEGTLFRLPLRTEKQAKSSEIKDLCYSRREMKIVLSMLAETAGSLILYTQNVRKVSVFHLPGNSQPQNRKLLFEVDKQTHLQENLANIDCLHRVGDPRGSILQMIRHAQEIRNTSVEIAELLTIDVKLDLETERFLGSGTGLYESSSLVWLVTWSASERSQETAVGGVAVPLQRVDDSMYIPVIPSHVPFGFYRTGMIYCFLPLPETTDLPVMLNGTFVVESSRRQLCRKCGDDKTNDEAEWNEMLLYTEVAQAYIFLLKCLKSLVSLDFDFFQLWPTAETCSKQYISLISGFYEKVVKENPVILPGETNWSGFAAAIFMDSTWYSQSSELHRVAFMVFKQLVMPKTAIDVPLTVVSSFVRHAPGNCYRQQEMSIRTFFTTIFLPNIHTVESCLCTDLVVYALGSSDKSILDKVSSTRCIPVNEDGEMKCPSDLIHPEGKAASLYTHSDGRFPFGAPYLTHKCLTVLESLGMTKDDLSATDIIERAESVSLSRVSYKKAVLRYEQLGKYLSLLGTDKLREIFTAIELQILSAVAFVPVKQRPRSWPATLQWKADEYSTETLECPQRLYHGKVECCVATTRLLVSEQYLPQELLRSLGVHFEIDLAIVRQQLENLSCLELHGNKEQHQVERIYETIYEYLQKLITGGCDLEELTRELHGNIKIYVDGQLVIPSEVAISNPFDCDCSPVLLKLSSRYKSRYLQALLALGVKQEFGEEDVRNALDNVCSDITDTVLMSDNIKLVIQVAKLLTEVRGRTPVTDLKSLDGILLPDQDGRLAPINTLCFDDCSWLPGMSLRFIHDSVPVNVAEALGVKTKRRKTLTDHMHELPFGQYEELTNRLRGIVKGYPCDQTVFKELLQNADDAGATEIHFIKDFRTHPDEKVFSDSWKSLQGPAICVYNNKPFTSEDMKGIQKLGEGSKRDDPNKTGQYGVGFNAVYNLTDVPSFLTCGGECEDSLCIFDPHGFHIDGRLGIRVTGLQDLRIIFPDVFGSYLDDHYKGVGTMFRFPLRDKSMAEQSSIKKIPISKEDVTKLFDDFKSEAKEVLLFVTNVKSIKIMDVSEGQLTEDVSVTATLEDTDVETMKEFKENMKDNGDKLRKREISVEQIELKDLEYVISIKNNDDLIERWLVKQWFGFPKGSSIPDSVKEACQSGELGLLPHGGIAVPYQMGSPPKDCRAFCYLPLPIQTGLPVVVHGHFALDYESRRNLFMDRDGEHQTDWNKCLLTQLLAPLYVLTIESLKTRVFREKCPMLLKLTEYHKFFPHLSNASGVYWNILAESIYRCIGEGGHQLFPVVQDNKAQTRIKWTSVVGEKASKAYFNTLQRQVAKRREGRPLAYETKRELRFVEVLGNVLIRIGFNLTVSPVEIFDNLKTVGVKAEEVQPESVLFWLKTYNSNQPLVKLADRELPVTLNETQIFSEENLQKLIKYCKSSEQFWNILDGLPLLLTTDNLLRCFVFGENVYFSDFADILKESRELVLHSSVMNLFKPKHGESFPMPVIPLTIAEFARILPQCLDVSVYGCGREVACDDLWTCIAMEKSWLLRTLQFLQKEVKSPEGTDHTKLEVLSAWSLLPVKAATTVRKPTSEHFREKFSYQLKLCPTGQRWKVFDFSRCSFASPQRILSDILRKFHVLELDMSMTIDRSDATIAYDYCAPLREFLSKLVITTEHPKSVLIAVYHQLTVHGCENGLLLPNEGRCLLGYFNDSLDSIKAVVDNEGMLKRLPCYVTIYDKCVAVHGKAVFVIPDGMPYDGTEYWSEKYDLVLLKNVFGQLSPIYDHLGFTQVSTIDLYLRYFLQELVNLGVDARLKHLEYIRDHMLETTGTPTNYNVQQFRLIVALKDLSFVQLENGTFKHASQFYDHHNDVMTKMLPSSKFLPKPFNHPEWYGFMCLLGIVIDISPDMFVLFANDVAENGRQEGLTATVRRKSQLLVKHMFKRSDICYGDLLETVRRIKFLIPHAVPNKLSTLHPQYGMNNEPGMICFQDASPGTHQNVLWTCSYLLSEYCDPTRLNYNSVDEDSLKKYKKFCRQLQIFRSPQISKVVDNMHNLCSKLGENRNLQRQNSDTMRDLLVQLFTEMYQAIRDSKDSLIDNIKSRLLDFAWVFLPNHHFFARPEQVVLEMESSKELVPYLFKCPPEFGLFQSFFEQVGANKSISANVYAYVLNQIFKETSGNELDANECKAASRAMLGLFHRLIQNNEIVSGISQLYLLTSDKCLADSTTTVFIDNPTLNKRVSTLLLPLVVKMDLREDPLTIFNAIPAEHKPRLLTETVQEKLEEESRRLSSQTPWCLDLQQTITSVEMQNGIARLLKHEWQEKQAEIILADVDGVLGVVSRLKLFSVDGLSTSLFYQGNKIPQSDTLTPFHSESVYLDGADSEVHIFIEGGELRDGRNSMVHNFIMQALDKALGRKSRELVVHLPFMLQDPEHISSYLDRMNIRASFTHVSSRQDSLLPEIGSYIPQVWHSFLDCGFCFFEEGEYVGFEVDDPLNSGQEGEATYLYAVIVERVDDGTVSLWQWKQRYMINVGKDEDGGDKQPISVQAIDLYKLIRPSRESGEIVLFEGTAEPQIEREQNQSLNEVKAEIFNTLKEVWNLDATTRRKVVKRLLLRWHPDKNIGNEEFCTKVTQYIQQIICRFESGNSTDITDHTRDSTDGSDSYWSPPRTSSFHYFFNSTNSRSRRYREYCGSPGSSYSRHEAHSRFHSEPHPWYSTQKPHTRFHSEPNPQPGVAKTWFRQSVSDWNAVVNDEDGSRPSPLWMCIKCQQTIEKALKAVLYAKNAGSSNVRSHHLSDIAQELAVPVLCQLVGQLDGVLGHQNYLRMRYPDMCGSQQIPADLFTHQQAQQAKQLTGRILEEIRNVLHL